MNTKLILKMVAPYLKNNNQLLFKDFKKLFSFLSRQEQYLVVDTLVANNIIFITDDGKVYVYEDKERENTVEDDSEIELDTDLFEDFDEDLRYFMRRIYLKIR